MSRVLFKMICLPPREAFGLVHAVKDALGLGSPGIYSILVNVERCLLEKTNHAIKTRVIEHHHHIQLYHPEKSAIAEHNTDLSHRLLLNTSNLVRKSRHTDQLIQEARE
jgi:hypothetical protein